MWIASQGHEFQLVMQHGLSEFGSPAPFTHQSTSSYLDFFGLSGR